MSTHHTVIGAGPVGRAVAEQLAGAGHAVRVLTRSGSGPDHPLVERRRADVAGPGLAEAVGDAHAVFLCLHASAYDVRAWRRELPALEAAVLRVAADLGAPVVFPESLYSYVRTDRPMTEDDPRDRATGKGAVRRDLLRARAQSPATTVSVVASDFVGPHVRAGGHLGERVVPALLRGERRRLRVLGSLDQPHSWTFVPDLARAMVVAAADPAAAGRVVHAPTAGPRTQREMIHLLAETAGVGTPPLGVLPTPVLRAVGLAHRQTRELVEISYQFERPFVLSSTASEARLGLRPTTPEEAARQTVAWWRDELGLDESSAAVA
ncbi:NAD-dependent epimerase/dehydratase family protein [Nocardioides sp. GXQ0305]|uniref:NAD-dependent epimerase/dehydratase family protein n=1 Tax=Nocardioides sp. GXQ0305 TaxID=3423912 RepID=UPI003D7CFC44